MINFTRDHFWSDVLISINTINSFIFAIAILYISVGRSRSLVKQESSFDLILSLLVPGWSSFAGNIPTMVINVSSIATGICGLRISAGDFLV